MAVETDRSWMPHPVALEVEYPERLGRVSTFFRLILAIPQFIVVSILMMVLYITTFIAWFAILFTGRYPKSMHEFGAGVLRWNANVYAYFMLLRDEYPPFSMDPGEYPLAFICERPERQSRFRLFIRLFAIIPNYIVFYFVQIGWWIVSVIGWFAILITGRYPRGLHKFSTGALRWYNRQLAYLFLLRDEYPPYSVKSEARPGNEVVSTIIGLPLGAAYIALYVAFAIVPFAGGGTTVSVDAAALYEPLGLEREAPTGKAGGIRITLRGYDDAALAPLGAAATPPERFGDWRLVSFDVEATKAGRLPVMYTPAFFFLDPCWGVAESATDMTFETSTEFDFFFRGGHQDSIVYFWVSDDAVPCRLTYFNWGSWLHFDFE